VCEAKTVRMVERIGTSDNGEEIVTHPRCFIVQLECGDYCCGSIVRLLNIEI
jgi:hypothetical protein